MTDKFCSESKMKDQTGIIEAIKQGLVQAEAGNFASEENVKSAFLKWGVDFEKT